MPNIVHTASNTVLSISAAVPATNDASGFTGLSYTTVAEVTDIGEYGATYAEVQHIPLATGIVQKFKGSLDYGNTTVLLGRDPDDAGQTLLRSNLAVRTPASFRVAHQDGSIEYFTARVMSYTTGIGSADNIVTASVSLGISSAIVEIPAP